MRWLRVGEGLIVNLEALETARYQPGFRAMEYADDPLHPSHIPSRLEIRFSAAEGPTLLGEEADECWNRLVQLYDDARRPGPREEET